MFLILYLTSVFILLSVVCIVCLCSDDPGKAFVKNKDRRFRYRVKSESLLKWKRKAFFIFHSENSCCAVFHENLNHPTNRPTINWTKSKHPFMFEKGYKVFLSIRVRWSFMVCLGSCWTLQKWISFQNVVIRKKWRYCDVSGVYRLTIGNLSTDVFETPRRTATGRQMQMLLAHFDLNQSVGKSLF